MPLLDVRDLAVKQGDVQILWGVSIRVEAGEVVCILGPNGCGKSTLMNSVSRLTNLVGGEIWFDGRPIHGLAAHEINRVGVSHVLERYRLFPYMTVYENLLIGAGPRPKAAFVRERFDRVYALFPRLAERSQQLAYSLSGGEQQMCAIGRALMSDPKLLMVDEPFIGLSPRLRQDVADTFRALNREGLAILVIEQNVREALAFSHRGYVLQSGQIRLVGEAAALAQDPQLEAIFVGRARPPLQTEAPAASLQLH
ncbi:MAG TPA: ABC transporter ATP-binding protein [Pseudolabrys sp.]|nr:ABC transporter ATP-binding protein [Pseudolabrys sp.]